MKKLLILLLLLPACAVSNELIEGVFYHEHSHFDKETDKMHSHIHVHVKDDGEKHEGPIHTGEREIPPNVIVWIPASPSK